MSNKIQYDFIADYYDIINNDVDYALWADYYDDLIKTFIKKDNITLLECGCGTGRFTIKMHDKGYKTEGVDISVKMIDIAKQKYPFIKFYEDDFTKMKKVQNKYDVILSVYDTVNHIAPEQIPSMLDIWKSKLNENGIIIFDYNTPEGLKFLNNIENYIIEGDMQIVTRIESADDGLYACMNITNENNVFKIEEMSVSMNKLQEYVGEKSYIFSFLSKEKYDEDDMKVVVLVSK